MADFGVGLASGVLIEVAKAIIEVVKEVRENKKQCEVLAQRCLTISIAIKNVVDVNKASLAIHKHTYSAVKGHVEVFNKILGAIQGRMKEWAEKKMWTRVFRKRSISNAIEELDTQLMDQWKLFEDFLALENLAVSSITAGLLIKSVQDNETARKEDAATNAVALKGIQESVTLAKKNQGSLDNQSITLAEILAGVKNFQNSVDEHEDPEAASARDAIREAIRAYEGERPSIGIDSSELTLQFKEPYHRGQNAEIFKGIRGGQFVAIKKLNIFDPEEINIAYRRILSEAQVWGQLHHPNVTQFLGCCRPQNDLAYMISAWAENGDARKYIKQRPEANRLKLLIDVVQGLEYLHTFVDQRSGTLTPIIHASVKGNHVLIDGNETARLSDFGIAFIANQVYPGSRPPATRWSAPEVLSGENPTIKSDIWSLGMVILELIVNKDPFAEHRYPDKLRQKIIRGTRPQYPTHDLSKWGLKGQDSPLWLLLQRCWIADPAKRPTNPQILEVLQAELAAQN